MYENTIFVSTGQRAFATHLSNPPLWTLRFGSSMCVGIEPARRRWVSDVVIVAHCCFVLFCAVTIVLLIVSDARLPLFLVGILDFIAWTPAHAYFYDPGRLSVFPAHKGMPVVLNISNITLAADFYARDEIVITLPGGCLHLTTSSKHGCAYYTMRYTLL